LRDFINRFLGPRNAKLKPQKVGCENRAGQRTGGPGGHARKGGLICGFRRRIQKPGQNREKKRMKTARLRMGGGGCDARPIYEQGKDRLGYENGFCWVIGYSKGPAKRLQKTG